MQTERDIERILDDVVEVTEASDDSFVGEWGRFWSEVRELGPGARLKITGLDEWFEYVTHYETVGNRHHIVFKVGDRTFRKDGEWVSHDGMYWEGGLFEVKPVEVTRTEWRRV